MSRKPTVTIEKFELDDLTKSIGFDRKAVARLCIVSTGSYGYWRFAGKIAREHLTKLTSEVIKRLGRRANLNPLQQRALDYSCSFQNETKGKTGVTKRKGQFERKKTKVDLSRVALTELAAEIERRGGEVSFKRAKIKRVP
jgi:hypothetical protein